MSQNPIIADVRMLPPNFTVYMKMKNTFSGTGEDDVSAVFVPVLFKPAQGIGERHTAFVPPLVVCGDTKRIDWCLVLLNQNTAVQFLTQGDVIEFKPSGVPHPNGNQIRMSNTQIAFFLTDTFPRETNAYDIWFEIPEAGVTGPVRIKAPIKGDPAVSVTSDPIDIPTWP